MAFFSEEQMRDLFTVCSADVARVVFLCSDASKIFVYGGKKQFSSSFCFVFVLFACF